MAADANTQHPGDGRDVAEVLRGAGYPTDVASRMEGLVRSEIIDMVERERAMASVARRINRTAQVLSWAMLCCLGLFAINLAITVYNNGYFGTSFFLFGCVGIGVTLLIKRIATDVTTGDDGSDFDFDAHDFAVAVRDLPMAKVMRPID
jgi:uncharacterized membrane protein